MKTKWQIWAHLLCTNYSISALKKITKWLRGKDIIDLEWHNVYIPDKNKGKTGPHDMTYFMEWYKDDSLTCATYTRLAAQIEERYNIFMARIHQKAINDIEECFKETEFRFPIPFRMTINYNF